MRPGSQSIIDYLQSNSPAKLCQILTAVGPPNISKKEAYRYRNMLVVLTNNGDIQKLGVGRNTMYARKSSLMIEKFNRQPLGTSLI